MDERIRAWLVLTLLPDLGRARINTLIRRFGSPEAILDASEQALTDAGIGALAVHSLLDWRRLAAVDEELRLIEKHGVSLTTILDDDYPANLARMAVPPPLLYYRGTLSPMDEAAVAVIGSRKISRYGRDATHQIVTDLARAGVTIVSGLALGVDAAAHQFALDAEGRTLAVLGTGLASIYPAQHKPLADHVAASGAVLTEVSMTSGPNEGCFPQRNSIIAALSLGVVVIEAAQRSGTSITVGYALEENRSVYAVPGDITRVNSVGTNRLIQDGARLVTCGRDILLDLRDELGRLLDNLPELHDPAEGQPAPLPANLNPVETAVLDALELDPLSIEALSVALAERDGGEAPVAQGDLMAALLNLELRGLVRQERGMQFRRMK
ncbi:MAG TPA: DNA-processing protein DprA [Candidatus Sumerlaeota bacterium]|nr:DNA-processing protein DprA [Candidatus Sumerlaeota bacterium]